MEWWDITPTLALPFEDRGGEKMSEAYEIRRLNNKMEITPKVIGSWEDIDISNYDHYQALLKLIDMRAHVLTVQILELLKELK
jgi:hypothetical protein